MGKKLMAGLILSAFIMIGLPLMTVLFVKAEAGLIVVFMMFYVIDPIWSVVAGIFAGTDIKRLWALPVASALMYLMGTWVIFEMGESAFVFMAIVYLVIGLAMMGITYFVLKRKNGV